MMDSKSKLNGKGLYEQMDSVEDVVPGLEERNDAQFRGLVDDSTDKPVSFKVVGRHRACDITGNS